MLRVPGPPTRLFCEAAFPRPSLLNRCLSGAVQYSADNGVVYIYGPPGFEPQRWGLPGNPYQPAMSSLPADYVEVFQ